MGVELGHVVAQEALSGLDRHRSVVGDQVGRELDVALYGVQLRRIEEAQSAALGLRAKALVP